MICYHTVVLKKGSVKLLKIALLDAIWAKTGLALAMPKMKAYPASYINHTIPSRAARAEHTALWSRAFEVWHK